MNGSQCTVIENVRIFDGASVTSETRTVVLSDGLISDEGADEAAGTDVADRVDGAGGVLLPGLIDAHVHIDTRTDLEKCVRAGITTVVDMATRDLQSLDKLRNLPGLPGLVRAGLPASAPGGVHTKKMGFDRSTAVDGPEDADRFVADRVQDGCDFIKLIVEDPKMPGTAALTPESIAALVAAGHRAGLKVVAHVVTTAAAKLAADGGVDALTHAPVNRALTAEETADLAARGVVLIPTLTMMRDTTAAIAGKIPFRVLRGLRIAPPVEFSHSRQSVVEAYAAGMTILAGTDANNEGGAPAHPQHGVSLHYELAFLVNAGLTPAEAITAATAGPAAFFGLHDRGAVAPGKRADLVLLAEDPTEDIHAVRHIGAVWVGGMRVDLEE
ncbi:MAG TPA: amidohydrolase family protein [Actinocrinis sp.]|nr:amidohydrolase family protein [Actinocrinis sp.]